MYIYASSQSVFNFPNIDFYGAYYNIFFVCVGGPKAKNVRIDHVVTEHYLWLSQTLRGAHIRATEVLNP